MKKHKLLNLIRPALADGDATGGGGVTSTPAPATSEPGALPPNTHSVSVTPEGASITMTTPLSVSPTPAEPDPSPFLQGIPEAYKDKPYLKGVDSLEKLLQNYENAQSLIGKKTIGIPDEKATDEDWQAFYNKLRPEAPDAYEFEPLKLPEDKKLVEDYLNQTRKPELERDVKALFHKIGLTKQQAQTLYQEYNQLFMKHNEDLFDEEINAYKKLNDEFDQLAAKTFGPKMDVALEKGGQFIRDNLTPGMEKFLPFVGNEVAILFADVAQNVARKYVSEDSPVDTRSTSGTGADSIHSQILQLRGTKEYTDQFHPQHEATFNRVQELYQQLAKLR